MLLKRSIFALVVSAFLLTTLPVLARDKVVLQLRWDHQFQFAGYYAAKWQGYYDQAGLDVDIRSAFEPDDKFHTVTQEVAEERADFGIAGADILMAQDKGDPLVIVNSVFQQSPVAFYSKSETNLHSPADLVGLRVGTRPGGVAGVELRAMLRAESIDPARVLQRPIQGNLGIHDIADGLLDVASGFTISAGWYARQLGLDLTALRPQSYGVDFYGDALFTQRKWIEQDPELVQKFATASLKGWEYALIHPKEVADRISRELSRKIPIDDLAGFNNFQFEPIHRLIQFPIVQLGHTNPFRWKKMHDALKDAGLVKGQFNSDQAIFDPARLEKKKFERNVAMAMSVVGVFIVLGILGWIVMLRRNLNARREIEKTLRESEARFRAITEASPVPLIITRRTDGNILYANPKVGPAFGLEADEVIGRSITEFYWDTSGREDRLAALEKDGYVRDDEVEMRKADGSPISTIHSLQVIEYKGEEAVLGGFYDITKRKQAEQEIQRLNEDLERRVEKRTADLRAAQDTLLRNERLSTLGQLTATVSHELRNPLGVIRTSAFTLRNELTDRAPLVTRALERIDRTVVRCDRIIDELLDFTRISRLEPEPTPLDAWLEETLNEQTLPSGVALRLGLDMPDMAISFDPERFRRAVINVFDNACQAMLGAEEAKEESGQHVLTVRTQERDGRIEIVFEDTGPGIPPDVYENIYEPLFSTKGFGVGLGLPVVKHIMEQHGGGIEIESGERRGTRVCLWLPTSPSTHGLPAHGDP